MYITQVCNNITIIMLTTIIVIVKLLLIVYVICRLIGELQFFAVRVQCNQSFLQRLEYNYYFVDKSRHPNVFIHEYLKGKKPRKLTLPGKPNKGSVFYA